MASNEGGIVERYITLGLSIGRHIDGFVDAYYGPPELNERVQRSDIVTPTELVATAKSIIGSIDAGKPLGDPTGEAEITTSPELEAIRRHWMRTQLTGMLTSARIMAGEVISYADEVEWCYGVRPTRVPDETIIAAHKNLDEVTPGSGPLAERLIAWRESQAVPHDKLEKAVHSLAEDLRERTDRLFGLPDGESVNFALVRNEPWSGFNYYLGNLKSNVAINVDLPVLSTSIGQLVAHEAYPGHHTEHTRKEVGLVRRLRFWEESIFLVGTPQCLLAEGLADLGLEVVMGRRPEPVIAGHLQPLGINYDPDVVAVLSQAGEALSAARANASFRLHEDHADPAKVIDELAMMALVPRNRAEKYVEFLMNPTWRSYISCYVEGLPLCRQFVGEKPEQFQRLISEQLTPADLISS